VESSDKRLDSVLRPILQVGAEPGVSAPEWPSCEMGHEEIQEVEAASPASGALARRDSR